MNTLFIAVLSVALSVSAQFSLKAGMSGIEVREALAQPLTLPSALTILTNQYVLAGFALYGLPLGGLGFRFHRAHRIYGWRASDPCSGDWCGTDLCWRCPGREKLNTDLPEPLSHFH